MSTWHIGARAAFGTAALIATLAAAHAQTPSPSAECGWGRKGGILNRHLKELDLTSAQSEQIKALRKDNREEMRKIRQAIAEKRRELGQELDKEKTEQAKIDGICADLKNLEGQRIDREIKQILQMKAVLTPEQFKKLGAMRAERRQERRGWWGRMWGEGRGRGGPEEPREKSAPPKSEAQ